MVRQGLQGSSSGSSEVTALQRLAAAGSEPLLAVGRALGAHLVHSLGSTTSVALTGGLSLIRLGVGTHFFFSSCLVTLCQKRLPPACRQHKRWRC